MGQCADPNRAQPKEDSPWLLEIVAGMVEAAESLEAVAKRETQEEAGVTVTDLLPICEYWTSPAVSTAKFSLFCGRVDARLAEGIHGLAAEGEDIRVHRVAVSAAYGYLAQGYIQHAPTLIGLQWLKLHEAQVIAQWKR